MLNEEEDTTSATQMLVLFMSELLATFMLLFLGCMGVCVPGLLGGVTVVPHWAAIGFGLAILIALQCCGHVSGGHMNPQITLGAVIVKKIKPILAPVYIAGQFVGAFLGIGLLKVVSPSKYTKDLCVTMVNKDVSIAQAVSIEIILTCILIIICGAIWDPRNSDKHDSIPIRFGLAIAGLALVAGPYTGASMNSVRTLAPAVISGFWKDQWIYWVGPTVGSILGAVIYRFILGPPSE